MGYNGNAVVWVTNYNYENSYVNYNLYYEEKGKGPQQGNSLG